MGHGVEISWDESTKLNLGGTGEGHAGYFL